MNTTNQMIRIARPGLALAIALLLTPRANATIVVYQLLEAAAYSQTSSAQPTALDQYIALEQIVSTSPGDLTGATFTGGGTTATLSASSNFIANQAYSTQAALNTALPNNTTYTFSLTGGSYNGQTATVTSPASSVYPTTIPYLTGTTYASLQNVNAANPIFLTFDSDSVGGSTLFATDVVIAGPGSSYNSLPIAPTIDSLMIPANTLLPGENYQLDLFSLNGTPTTGLTPAATGLTQQGDLTVVDFSTAPVPLPAAAWLLLSALGGLGIVGRQRAVLVRPG